MRYRSFFICCQFCIRVNETLPQGTNLGPFTCARIKKDAHFSNGQKR